MNNSTFLHDTLVVGHYAPMLHAASTTRTRSESKLPTTKLSDEGERQKFNNSRAKAGSITPPSLNRDRRSVCLRAIDEGVSIGGGSISRLTESSDTDFATPPLADWHGMDPGKTD